MAKLINDDQREQALKTVTVNLRRLRSYDEWIHDTSKLPEDGYVYKLNITCWEQEKEDRDNKSTMSVITSKEKLITLVKTSAAKLATHIKEDIKTYNIELDSKELIILNAFLV